MCVCGEIYTYICVYACMYIGVCVYICVCVCVCILQRYDTRHTFVTIKERNLTNYNSYDPITLKI